MENENIEDLTEGPLWKKIIIFILPLIASNLLQVAFNLSDIMVVGRFAGGIALGCVGSTATLVSCYVGIFIGIASGIMVKVAKSIGMKNEELVKKSIATSFYFSLFLGIIISFFAYVLAKDIMILLGTKEELIEGATLYLRIYLLGMPATSVYNFGNSVYSAAGNTKKPLMILTISGIINIVLNLFFVINLKMSVAGVALASCIGQYLSMILIMYSLSKEKSIIKVNIFHFAWDLNIIIDVISVGLPAALQSIIFSVANLFILAGINQLPLIMVQGNSAALNVDPLMYHVLDAIYIACSTFISQNYGAKKMDRIMEIFKITLIYSFTISVVAGLLMYRFGRGFLYLFTTESEIVEAGMIRTKVMALSFPLCVFMDIAISASRGIGKGTIPTIIVIIGSCVFRIIWVVTIFEHFKTPESLYLVYCVSWIITSIPEIIYFFKIYKEEVRKLIL